MQTRSGWFQSNRDFEFSQKINAQDGTSNSCLQKTGSEHLPWYWTDLVMKPQEGICFPFAA
jgi:hypothetical protein